MTVFIAGGVIISAGALTLGAFLRNRSRAKISYECGKYAAKVMHDTGDRYHSIQAGAAEMSREGIHYETASLKNLLSFRQGFEESHPDEDAASSGQKDATTADKELSEVMGR